MLIKRRKGWELRESLVTPESLFFNRRSFLAASAAALMVRPAFAEDDPSAVLYPAKANAKYADAGREVTPEETNITYNNYYEFGTSKRISAEAEKLPIRPWTVVIDGEVEAPMTLGIDDILNQFALEERIYRHRCVEAWSMVVPWSGFPMSKLVGLARPNSNAKYLRFESFNNPEIASGQKEGLFSSYPWPYVEGLTMAEAMNDLAFVVTGAYGKPVAKSMGAPIRIHMPWKYGFKSAKGIVRITFTAEKPLSFWEQLGPSEYGFWANVNPEVSHPRWSQAQEQVLGTGEMAPTQIFNGYGEFVADLYKGLEAEKLYM
jgi:methionine sulfoxide reductase catalytic subunit